MLLRLTGRHLMTDTSGAEMILIRPDLTSAENNRCETSHQQHVELMYILSKCRVKQIIRGRLYRSKQVLETGCGR